MKAARMAFASFLLMSSMFSSFFETDKFENKRSTYSCPCQCASKTCGCPARRAPQRNKSAKLSEKCRHHYIAKRRRKKRAANMENNGLN